MEGDIMDWFDKASRQKTRAINTWVICYIVYRFNEKWKLIYTKDKEYVGLAHSQCYTVYYMYFIWKT